MKEFKIFVTAALLFLLFDNAHSQDQPQHEQKTYVAENGKIYWNKYLPVYVKLATTSNGGEEHVMKVEPSKGDVEPFYFDTEGPNWIRTRWAVNLETGRTIYPKREILWPVFADGVSPVTSIKYHYTGKHVVKGKVYYSGDLKISLSAKDAVSGIEGTYYSIGNGYKKYDGQITVDTEKDWNFRFYSVDMVGNAESAEQVGSTNLNFTIDNTAPTSTLSIDGPKVNSVLSPKAKFNLESIDNGAGVKNVYYQIDESGNIFYSSNINLHSLEDGDHTIYYSASDHVKNEEETKSFNFYLDKTPPSLSFSIEGDEYTNSAKWIYVSQRSKFKLSGSDEKAGLNKIYYKVDANKLEEYSSVIAADQTPGVHYLTYYGDDKVENRSKNRYVNYTIDNKPPVIYYKSKGPNFMRDDTLFVRSITEFTLNPYDAGENQSGLKEVKYQINGGNPVLYTEKFTIPGNGVKNLSIDASDNVNNTSNKKQTLFMDNDPPEIKPSFSVDQIGSKKVRDESFIIYPKEVKVYLAATDKHVGTETIFYSVGGGEEKTYTRPIQYFRQGSNVTIDIRALDILGNESKKTLTFSVE